VQSGTNSLLQFLRQLSEVIAALLAQVEDWLQDQMQGLGVPPLLQTLILLSVAVLVVVGAVRLFAGLARVAVVLALVLLAVHLVMPAIQQ
jgi:hypothetical protein